MAMSSLKIMSCNKSFQKTITHNYLFVLKNLTSCSHSDACDINISESSTSARMSNFLSVMQTWQQTIVVHDYNPECEDKYTIKCLVLLIHVFVVVSAPNFVSSMAYEDYIFFFFRETAVEYINCGKVRE